jgi:RNA polymerase sigma-70 factor (ECF subfamily)
MTPTDDRGLVLRLQRGDEAALKEVAALFGPCILRVAMRRLPNREDAEEVTQDVLLRVWTQVHTFRHDAALASWIYRITVNTTLSRLRAGGRARRSGVAIPLEAPADGDAAGAGLSATLVDRGVAPDERIARAQVRRAINTAVARLPRDMRHAVALRYALDLTPQEAGALLHVKPQTIRTRLNRGRRLLRQRLACHAAWAPGASGAEA